MISSPRREREKRRSPGSAPDHLGQRSFTYPGRSRASSDPAVYSLRDLPQPLPGLCAHSAVMPMGHVYPGPIGKILTPQMEGLDRAGALVGASSLCGACGEVCPVRIPIPDLIRRLRTSASMRTTAARLPVRGHKRTLAETMIWKGWELANRSPAINRVGTRLASAMGDHLPKVGPLNSGRGFAMHRWWPVAAFTIVYAKRGE